MSPISVVDRWIVPILSLIRFCLLGVVAFGSGHEWFDGKLGMSRFGCCGEWRRAELGCWIAAGSSVWTVKRGEILGTGVGVDGECFGDDSGSGSR
ncbi:hypothetical protein GQ457_04G023580 [Hibiscus cannabinus]